MLQIKHAPNDVQSMSQDGTAILRSLQNKSLPTIDLMVRESLQNSLDATVDCVECTSLNFFVGKFNSSKFAVNLEGITEKLLSKYPNEETFIAVSDKNTYGLEGDYLTENREILEKSNFQKLVFGIGKNQEKDGSGGSWGLGKTSYFRLGVGIVLYYTRIKIEEKYEERLIASLIESPKDNERLLSNNDRGIAWWGKYQLDSNKILPLTETKEIEDILSIFNIKRYKDRETGTTIIIPYIKDREANNIDEVRLPWRNNLEEEVNMAVQRWYFPRIMNTSYAKAHGNSYLKVKINNIPIIPELNLEPVFKIYQEIYTSALLGKSIENSITVKPIILGKNALANQKEPIGYIAFKEVSKEELKMTPPENKTSGLSYLGVKDVTKIKNHNSKVIAYCRKPGMVVEYAVDSTWSPSEQLQQNGNLLLGFFVPVSRAKLDMTSSSMVYKDVEQYLRATEQSDHASWKDEDNVTIISRIQKYCSQAIKEHYQIEDGKEMTTATSALSRKFGSLLMPPLNFGKSSKRDKPNNPGKNTNKNMNRNTDITIIDSEIIDKNKVLVKIRLFLRRNNSSEIYLQVLSQEKKIDSESWNKSMQGIIDFPFEIDTINFNSNDHVEIQRMEGDNTRIVLHVNDSKKDIDLTGSITLNIKSSDYIPNIAVRTC